MIIGLLNTISELTLILKDSDQGGMKLISLISKETMVFNTLDIRQ